MSIVILTPNSVGHLQVFAGSSDSPDHYRRIRISERCITASSGIDKNQSSETHDVFINFTKEEWESFKKSIQLVDIK